MKDTQICQIYHVARCGSSLLTAILSNCAYTYSEPQHTKSLFLSNSLSTEMIHYNGSIIKMQSIGSRIAFKPEGPKVFLYRPLSQYLQKMTEVTTEWLAKRKDIYGEYFIAIQGTELPLEPENIMQLHTIFWSSCVIEMQKTRDVLWIKSNDFFSNKEVTAKSVLTHFGLEGNPDLRFADINVKSLFLNGKTTPIEPFESYITEDTEYVTGDRGIIDTSTALENPLIFETIEWAKSNIPLNADLYY